MVANRVDPETGKAAKLGNSKLRLSRWAEARLWEKVEDRRWLEFWRLESRARKQWAELHTRQEDTRQRLDRESRTVLGRLRIWRTERSLRELVGAVRGREKLVEGWREDLDRYHKGERAALGKAHADSARQIERGGKGGLPKGAAGRGAARTGDPAGLSRQGSQADGAGNEGARPDMGAGARPEHDPHSTPGVRAPRPRTWRGRVRAVTLYFASGPDGPSPQAEVILSEGAVLLERSPAPGKDYTAKMKSVAYIETSVVSYLTARPSRDVVIVARQQVTREWWRTARDRFHLAASEFVIREARQGDPNAARARLMRLDGVTLLDASEEAEQLARELIASRAVPPSAAVDGRPHRHRRYESCPLSCDLELPPHRQCDHAVPDRAGVPERRVRAPRHLHSQRTDGGQPWRPIGTTGSSPQCGP